MKTCINRLIGRCKECKIDYNTKHHPNNYDCPDYHEAHIQIFEVENKEEYLLYKTESLYKTKSLYNKPKTHKNLEKRVEKLKI